MAEAASTRVDVHVPLLFLDVDGVLCPLGEGHSGAPHAHEGGPATVGVAAGLWVCWSSSVVDRVNRWVRDELLEVRWVTTWEQLAARKLASVLGLPEFDVVTLDQTGPGGKKAAAVAANLAGEPERAFVWVDDDLTGSWSRAVPSDRPRLLIRPRTHTGLTGAHLNRIERFATSQR